MEQKRSLSAIDVAAILHISKNTVYELIKRGELKSYKVGRKIRFTQEDIDDYISRSRYEKQFRPIIPVSVRSSLLNGTIPEGREFILSGHDMILDILSNYLRQYGYRAMRTYVNSFESLLSLY
ncbi:MAG: helix-turn-helix domain-containing protein, partial [Lachnospiraceae bacterium]|nr:helix-turn-helix domain-containing protein [Lachnospiraceae bacterium]